MKNRFVDFLKGFAIICVLYGHCIQYGSGSTFLNEGLYWENTVMKVIYSFHMPLFIAVSGFLFFSSYQRYGPKKSFLKRVCVLTPICGTWACLLLVVDLLKGNRFTVLTGMKQLVKYFLTDFWFLWAVLFCVCCVILIELAFGKLRGKALFVWPVLFVLFILTPDILWFNAHKFMAPYFLCGFYYAKNGRRWLEHRGVGIAATIAWIILLIFYSKDSYIYTTGMTILGKHFYVQQIIIVIYRYVVGFAGTVSAVFIMKKIHNWLSNCHNHCAERICRLVEYLGRNSIVYYILSTYIFAWLVPPITRGLQLNYLLTAVETMIVGLMCFVIGHLLRRVKWLSRYVIGQ